MYQVIFSPEWFYGKDIIIDIFSIFVLSLIAFFSIRFYNLNKKNKNYFWFAVSFIILAFSFLFKILMNFTIYYNIIKTQKFGFITLTYSTIATSDLLSFIGFLFYMFLTLLGLFILYSLYKKESSWQNYVLITYFLLIIIYFSASRYYVFHLTSLLLLFFITLNYNKNYQKNKNRTILLLTLSFFIITISQLVFIFITINPLLYVIAEIIQLIGYVLLSITFIKVVKNAKKK
jgi:hypothetical protein